VWEDADGRSAAPAAETPNFDLHLLGNLGPPFIDPVTDDPHGLPFSAQSETLWTEIRPGGFNIWNFGVVFWRFAADDSSGNDHLVLPSLDFC